MKKQTYNVLVSDDKEFIHCFLFKNLNNQEKNRVTELALRDKNELHIQIIKNDKE